MFLLKVLIRDTCLIRLMDMYSGKDCFSWVYTVPKTWKSSIIRPIPKETRI